MMCICCNKRIKGGGINMFKAHLAGQKGQVEACKKVHADVQHEMKQLLEHIEKNKKRKVQQEQSNKSNTFEMDENPMRIGKNTLYANDYFMPKTTPRAQPSLKSVLQNKQIVEKCDKVIAKWMIDASVPFNAINSTYYQPMIDAISSMSPRKLVESYKEVWMETECTLMVDGWIDRSRRTVINFLVYCPKGTIFLRYVDASYASKTVEMLFKIFKEMVLYVGAENVVHIVTDGAINYVATGRLLEKEFPKIYWSACAAHYINLILQDCGKFEEVSEIVSHASKITKYIYNHCYVLFLMRQHTSERDILRPTPTRFPTNFIALQSILDQKDALRAIEMVRRFQSNKKKVEPYLEVLDRRWDSQLRKDLHAAGYWLNLTCRFNAEEFEKHMNTQSGILELIDRYTHGDLEFQDRLNEDMKIYKNSEGDFGKRDAIREHNTIMLDQCQTCSASGCEKNWSIFEHIHSKRRNMLEHQKLNDLVYVCYNLRLQQRNRESPPFLTREEVEDLPNDLANMFIQSISNDIGMFLNNINEYEDDDVSQPPDNTMKDVNPNENNIGEESHSFDEE
ncbi:hypothetical protein GYH30_019022 [Glycine max]|nr:hypothetical protein GYH30_019022 [Glycine max]